MSNTKRDWMNEDGFADPRMRQFWDQKAEGNGYSLNLTDMPEILDMAAQIVRRELAGEVEKMKRETTLLYGFDTIHNRAIDKVLALLSPQNEKDQ